MLGQLFRLQHDLFQGSDLLGCRILTGSARRKALEDNAAIVELNGIVSRNPRNPQHSIFIDCGEVFVVEEANGFSNGGTADLEAIGQLRFDEAIAGFEFPRQNGLAQGLVGLFL
jgi:hypothetical protein